MKSYHIDNVLPDAAHSPIPLQPKGMRGKTRKKEKHLFYVENTTA